jgi:hypothetical protein
VATEPLDRRNRTRWTLIGAALLAVGAAGLLAGGGVFGHTAKRKPLLSEWVVERWHDWYPWDLVVAGVLGLLLAWYGWRLLRTELRSGDGRPAMGGYEYRPGGRWRPQSSSGRTMVRSGAVRKATRAALQRVMGVQRAVVGLFGNPERPELRTQLDVDSSADLEPLRDGVTATIERLATTTGIPPRMADVTIRLVERKRPRVT